MVDNRRQYGFTFVELFAATAICAILMIAVTGVIGAIGKPPVEASNSPAFDVLEAASEQLQWDFANARYAKFDHNVLTLRGYGSLDTDTLEPNHRPTQIKYYFEATGEGGWLVRQQRDYDVVTDDSVSRQLVLTGLDQILIQVLSQPMPINLDEMDDEADDSRIADDDERIDEHDEEQDNESDEERDEEDGEDDQEEDDGDEEDDELAAEEDELNEYEEFEIEWLDLKQGNKWFVVPDVIKFVFVPVLTEEDTQAQLAYDGYDWMEDDADEEIAYPQKVLLLR